MKAEPVFLGENSNRTQPELGRRAKDADRDLTTIQGK
jgi:hypothetical protein